EGTHTAEITKIDAKNKSLQVKEVMEPTSSGRDQNGRRGNGGGNGGGGGRRRGGTSGGTGRFPGGGGGGGGRFPGGGSGRRRGRRFEYDSAEGIQDFRDQRHGDEIIRNDKGRVQRFSCRRSRYVFR